MTTVSKEPQLLEHGYEIQNLVVVDENYSTAAEEVNSGHDEVVNKLKNKFKDFKTDKFLAEPELFNKLAKQQEPKVMLISCIDSRCNPTMLLGLEPGEAFVVRNVAALVHPYHEQHLEHENGIGAATQFAVSVMNVEHIVVVGHSSCGGIKALMSRDDFTTDLVGGWVKIALPAKKKAHLHSHQAHHNGELAHHEQMSVAEKEAVNVSLKNLLTYPFIEERVKDGRLQIHGMHYDLTEGKLTCWDIVPRK
jgi:carbonic anhydrase